MRGMITVVATLLLAGGAFLGYRWYRHSTPTENVMETSLHQFQAARIDGTTEDLSRYKGKTVLVVNVASRCGLTSQYEGLQELYDRYKDRGFVVLGFPANNFLGQEPGSNAEIAEFCRVNYKVTFPMFAKISVKGGDTHPLFRWLIARTSGVDVEWNFAKFLINGDGEVVQRFAPNASPTDPAIIAAIEKLLPEAQETENAEARL